MWFKWLWISLLGAVICLDNVAIGQFLISRPICCGSILGLVLGDIRTGLIIGALLEILWITPIPVGAIVLPDIETSCITATAISVEIVKAGLMERSPMAGLAICISLPVAFYGQYGGIIVRRINNKLSESAIKSVDKSYNMILWVILGIFVFFMRYFLTCFISLIIFMPVVKFLIPKLTVGLIAGLNLVAFWCPIIGLATVLGKSSGRRKLYLIFLGFILAFLLNGLFPDRAIINLFGLFFIVIGFYVYTNFFNLKCLKKRHGKIK